MVRNSCSVSGSALLQSFGESSRRRSYVLESSRARSANVSFSRSHAATVAPAPQMRPQLRPYILVDRRSLRRQPDRIEPAADRRDGARRKLAFALRKVVQRLDRRLRVARARQSARLIARLGAQPPRIVAEKGFHQPQQRAPALHHLAQVVNRYRVGPFRVIEHGARLGQDIARDGSQSLADRNIRTNGGFLGHVRLL